MALFLAVGYLQSSAAIKKPEFLATIQTSSSMARNKTDFLAIRVTLFEDRNLIVSCPQKSLFSWTGLRKRTRVGAKLLPQIPELPH